MALRDLIDYLASSTPATALRGIGEGASMGLTRYPAAGISYLASKAAGYNPQFKDVLSSIREQEQQLQQQQPIAYTGGNVLGSLIPLPTKAVGALPTIARSAAQGAISGFTQNEGMENVARDVALGTFLGTGGGAIGAALPKAQETIVRAAAKQGLTAVSKPLEKLQSEAYDSLKNSIPGISKRKINDIAEGKIAEADDIVRKAEFYKGMTENIQSLKDAKKTVDTLKGQELLDRSKMFAQQAAEQQQINFGKMLAEPLFAAGVGTAGGAAAGMLTGQDPLSLAILGGGTAGLYNLKLQGLKTLGGLGAAQLTKVPYTGTQLTGEYLGGRLTRAAVPVVVPEIKTPMTEEVKPWEMTWEAPVSSPSAVAPAPSESPAPQSRNISVQSQQQKPWEMDWGNK